MTADDFFTPSQQCGSLPFSFLTPFSFLASAR
jgi:hypothetical protein